MPTSTVTNQGQVTLPKEVREHLHLAAGDRLEFVIEEGGAVRLRPVSGSVQELFGMLRNPGRPAPSLEELDQELSRSLAADDERIRSGRE
jgi:AbrB family looped-hinge helix DNA binding protein